MDKWSVTLTTTEPENYIGIIKVRQGNKNTEVLQAVITENGIPLDLTGCTVTFQSLIGGEYPIERPTTVTNAKAGTIEYVFDDYSMQALRTQTANFTIKKGDELIGSTQNFTYFVINAVSKTPGEMGSYWQSAEDLINDMKDYLNTGKSTSQALLDDMQKYLDAGKGDFQNWVDSMKSIIESIDPGGRLLAEVLDLNKIIYRKVPSGFNVVIEHDSEYQPDVKVTYYKNSIGTEENGFDTGPSFGGERIYNLASSLSYIRNKVNVELPSVYTMDGEVVNNGNELLLINGTEVIRFVIEGATITKGYVEKVKPPTNLTVSDVTSSSAKVSWENG